MNLTRQISLLDAGGRTGHRAKDRLIIDTHLEVWTLDPKFPFAHPERPEPDGSDGGADREPSRADEGLRSEVCGAHQPALLRLGQLLHQLQSSQVSEALRRARPDQSGRPERRRPAALLGEGARLSGHALQSDLSSEIDVAELERALSAVEGSGAAGSRVQLTTSFRIRCRCSKTWRDGSRA